MEAQCPQALQKPAMSLALELGSTSPRLKNSHLSPATILFFQAEPWQRIKADDNTDLTHSSQETDQKIEPILYHS
jgi:hypothetical protein